MGQYLAYSNRDFDLFDAEAANVASDRFRSRSVIHGLPVI